MDQDVLSGFECSLLKSVERGDEDLRNRTCSRPLEVRWHNGNCILMGRHEFVVAPAGDDAHDAIAFTPTVGIRTQLCDFTGKLQSRDVLRSTRRRSVSTSPLQEIG